MELESWIVPGSARVDHAALESYLDSHRTQIDILTRQKTNSHKDVQVKFDAMGFTIEKLALLHSTETDKDLKESIYEIMEKAVNTLNGLIDEGKMFLRREQMEKATRVIPPRLEDAKSKSSEQSSYKNVTERGAKNSGKEHNSSSKRQCDDQDDSGSKRHRSEDNKKWEKPRQRDEVSTSRQIPPESDEEVEGAIFWDTPVRRCIHRYACTQGFHCTFAHNEKEYDWFHEPVYKDYVDSKDRKISAEFLDKLASNRKLYAKRFKRQIYCYTPNSFHNDVRHGRGGGNRGGRGGGNYERSTSSSSRDH